MDPLTRLLSHVDVGLCWEWTGQLNHGYGRAHMHGRLMSAHVAIWELLVGPVPDGLELDHLCLNRRCVNPDHLEPVTRGENMRRTRYAAMRRAITHCPQDHEYTPENTRVDKNGCRVCRTCRRLKERERRERARAVVVVPG